MFRRVSAALLLVFATAILQAQTTVYTWSAPNYSCVKPEDSRLNCCPYDKSYDKLVPAVWLQMWDAYYTPSIPHLKQIMDSMPEGNRCFHFWNFRWEFDNDPRDILRDKNDDTLFFTSSTGVKKPFKSIWREHGIDSINRILDTFMNKYSKAGGKLDVMMLDIELGISNWELSATAHNLYEDSVEAYCRAIAQDPRWASIETWLDGCKLYPDVVNFWSSDCYLKFNSVMAEVVAEQENQAFYNPVKKYFPEVKCSDYGFFKYTQEYAYKDFNGHNSLKYGKGAVVGTHQSQDTYGLLGQLSTVPGKEPIPGKAFPRVPFNSLLYSVNVMRSMRLSDTLPIMPWIAFRTYFSNGDGTPQSHLSNHDYWQECILHHVLCMNEKDNFLFWNDSSSQPYADDYELSNAYFNRCMRQADAIMGSEKWQPRCDSLADWYGNTIISKAETPTRIIYRLTPKLDSANNTFQKILVKKKPAEFLLSGKTITFPEGEVVFFSDTVSKAGYWIIQQKNSIPTAPGNLKQVSITKTTLTVSWNAATDNIGVTGYDVFVNGAKAITVSDTFCTITSLNMNTEYSVSVKARDAAGNISASSNEINVRTLPSSIGSFSAIVAVYPNPATERIMIDGVENDFEVSVFNQTGQLIVSEINQREINVSGWMPGVYTIRVAKCNTTEISRIIIIR